MIFGRSSCLFMDPKRVFSGVGFFFPSFYYNSATRVKESKTGRLKTPKNGQKRSSRRKSRIRLAIERFFRQSSNARAREEVDSNLGIFVSKIHLPSGEKAVQIAFY
jgi:hypothetical protein